MQFLLDKTDGPARLGRVFTDHGVFHTPAFMPVGTQGTVKAIQPRELEEIGAEIILGNTYHLYLRPGTEILEQSGGLHKFNGWKKPILTDSGGFQVFSLSELRKISEEGVQFRSHLDGSTHFFTPENVVDTQRSIGSDIMMVLDECTPYPSTFEYAKRSGELTLRWAERCLNRFRETEGLYGYTQALFGIVQGSTFPELRKFSANGLVGLEFDGYAIGGLAVGEPTEAMYEMISVCTEILPENKPRYLMGVGTPENLLEAIERGIDMFDCVMPTRNGRNAMLFTSHGNLNITNAQFKNDFEPVDAKCGCYTCQSFSRAYVSHLFRAKEILGLQLATIHNLAFYQTLMKEARHAIACGEFAQWKKQRLFNQEEVTEYI
ncbi:MAG: tRNA guanosine(34) transglycosylase Tgt [Ignavibacteriae bacterium]|nr:tRNA guanosine(34) transglycosylase Tgt [Ignavibacteriota bacterium]